MATRTYRDLEVFTESYDAALQISKLTGKFPMVEQPELARQLRRSARSIPANIGEGWAKRDSPAEFKRYLQVAMGSCHETRVWLDMSKDEGYLKPDEYEMLTKSYDRVGVMLYGLWKRWSKQNRVLSQPPDLLTS